MTLGRRCSFVPPFLLERIGASGLGVGDSKLSPDVPLGYDERERIILGSSVNAATSAVAMSTAFVAPAFPPDATSESAK